VVAGKYYPAGVTTNSHDGVSDFESVFPVIEIMERLGFVLCVHGEEPGEFCLDREESFIRRVETLVKTFPRLRIVFEHLSTESAVKAVYAMPDTVAATITVHHLLHTLDDVIGDGLQPHHFCKPLPKRPADRFALRSAAFSGNPKFFLGTDSAPHLRGKKECPCGAAGVYSAPVAIPLLIQIFEREDVLRKLSNFIGGFGADFYGIPRQTQKRTYVRQPWVVRKKSMGWYLLRRERRWIGDFMAKYKYPLYPDKRLSLLFCRGFWRFHTGSPYGSFSVMLFVIRRNSIQLHPGFFIPFSNYFTFAW
jgi:dihydroorotase